MQSVTQALSGKLLNRALQLEKLNKLVKSALPADCHPHVACAGIRDTSLILVSDSPVWSSKIRLYSALILNMVQELGSYQVQQVQVRQTVKKFQPHPRKPAVARKLGPGNARLIRTTADSIEDEDLKNALLKLANRRG